MLGAVLGDIIGSTREWNNIKSEEFELFPTGSHFTDDSVMSIAVADKLLHTASGMNNRKNYAMWYKQYYKRFSNAGYGQMFSSWAESDNYYVQKSYGNGASMRVTAIGYAFKDLKSLLKEVKDSCYYTHKNKEAMNGAEAVAIAVFLAKKQEDKESIKKYIEKEYKYVFEPLDEIREDYVFDSRTSYSVPPALEAFFESDSYESAIRKAISIGGDSDTIACIAGGIAEAYYKKIPEAILSRGLGFVDGGFKSVIKEFMEKYGD
ncbi:MAG: ADP-ribosylglycohydrolase family protein [Eubacteriales bacterium]|nr:ADP-ribosylglycohydrolase family protein [Eubacteriales bacterium]